MGGIPKASEEMTGTTAPVSNAHDNGTRKPAKSNGRSMGRNLLPNPTMWKAIGSTSPNAATAALTIIARSRFDALSIVLSLTLKVG